MHIVGDLELPPPPVQVGHANKRKNAVSGILARLQRAHIASAAMAVVCRTPGVLGAKRSIALSLTHDDSTTIRR